jgi:putative glycosyltransferase (TIGR04372 family)
MTYESSLARVKKWLCRADPTLTYPILILSIFLLEKLKLFYRSGLVERINIELISLKYLISYLKNRNNSHAAATLVNIPNNAPKNDKDKLRPHLGLAFQFFFERKEHHLGSKYFIQLSELLKPSSELCIGYSIRLLYYGGRLQDAAYLLSKYKLTLSNFVVSTRSDSQQVESGYSYDIDFWAYSIGHHSLFYYLLLSLEQRGINTNQLSLHYIKSGVANNVIFEAILNRFNISPNTHSSKIRFDDNIQKPESLLYTNEKGYFLTTEFIFNVARSGSRRIPLELDSAVVKKCQELLSEHFRHEVVTFVTLHVRNRPDGSLRNTPISLVKRSVDWLAEMGIYTIRIGQHSDTLDLIKGESYLDLAGSGLNSPELNAFALTQCLFSIQNSSGPHAIPHLFGRPTLHFDIFPPLLLLPYPDDLFIPRLILDSSGNILSLEEIRRLNLYSEVCLESSYKTVRPNDKDILDGVLDMYRFQFQRASFISDPQVVKLRKLSEALFDCKETSIAVAPLLAPSFVRTYPELIK